MDSVADGEQHTSTSNVVGLREGPRDHTDQEEEQDREWRSQEHHNQITRKRRVHRALRLLRLLPQPCANPMMIQREILCCPKAKKPASLEEYL